jgi:hypothetical protein
VRAQDARILPAAALGLAEGCVSARARAHRARIAHRETALDVWRAR